MKDAQPPCIRCKKRGLSCTVNRSLQMILESDVAWKDAIEEKLERFEQGLRRVANHLSLTHVVRQDDDHMEHEPATEPKVSFQPVESSSNVEKHAPDNWEIVMDPDAGPAAIPGSVVSPVVIQSLKTHGTEQDILSRGVLPLDEAQTYLDVYQDRLDHFLYRIIGDRRSLDEIRNGSPLLLSAICAVGSLHVNSSAFEKCYQDFVSVAAGQTFSRRNHINDIRGLCIGAFWLSGISWNCIGAAVRISTEIQLHRSVFKALRGDRKHYLRTRLYYLVYVCDHHFSIAYGRPPMTQEDDAIRATSRFLDTENAVEDDARLVSQVFFWLVGSDIYNTLGIDVDRPLDLAGIEPLRRFSIRLDNLRADWTKRFSYNKYVGNYPRKGVGLHYHFAKLYLFSMAFRGVGKPGFKTPDIALDIEELANAAILSATSILKAVVTDTEVQSYLNGLPTYFDVMIAFAVVFVLKISKNYASYVQVDVKEIHRLVRQLVEVLKNVTASMHPRHLLVSVARGAETLLEACSTCEMQLATSNANVTIGQHTFGEVVLDESNAWAGNPFNDFFMGEFDFLSSQDAFSSFQPDL